MTHTWHKQPRDYNQSGSHLSGRAWVLANNRSGAFLAGYNDAVAGRADPLNGIGRKYDEQRRYERGRLTAAIIHATKPLATLTLAVHSVAAQHACDTVAFGK